MNDEVLDYLYATLLSRAHFFIHLGIIDHMMSLELIITAVLAAAVVAIVAVVALFLSLF